MSKYFFTAIVIFFTLNLFAACDNGSKEKNEYPEEIQRYCELLAPCGVGMYQSNALPEGSSPDAWTSEAGCREYLWQMKQLADVEGEKNSDCYAFFLDMLEEIEYKIARGDITLPPDEAVCDSYTHNLAYFECYPEGYE